MGVDSFFHPKIGGGVSLFYALSAYSKGASVLPAFILSGRQFSAYRGKFSAKQGKSEFFFGVLWCFLGIFGDQKGQKWNIFWVWGFRGAAFILFCGGGGSVHLWQVVVSTECRWLAFVRVWS